MLLAVAIGTAFTILGLALVQAATACALVDIDSEKERPDPVTAYRQAFSRTKPLLGSVAIVAVVWALCTWTAFLIPIGIWLAVRWALVAQVVELKGQPRDRRPCTGVRSSRAGTGGGSESIVSTSTGLAIVAGPFVGAMLILLTD